MSEYIPTIESTMSMPQNAAPRAGGGANNDKATESIVNVRKILAKPFANNHTAAAFYVNLSLIEASENDGIPINPTSSHTSNETSNFRWANLDKEIRESIFFSINQLLVDPPSSDDSLKDLIQNILIPRGIQIIEENNTDELLEMLISIYED